MAEYFTASTIVLIFIESVSRFILDPLDYFSFTTVVSNYSPTSNTGRYYFNTTPATTAVSVWPSVIPDTSIVS